MPKQANVENYHFYLHLNEIVCVPLLLLVLLLWWLLLLSQLIMATIAINWNTCIGADLWFYFLFNVLSALFFFCARQIWADTDIWN